MRKAVILLVLACLLPAQKPKKKIKFDESFDPSSLKEPEIKLPIILRPDAPLPPEFSPVDTDTIVDGFRVQVIATQDYAEATQLVTQLEPLFADEIYVVFDSPNYKVRIGNYRSRANAENARERIAALGHNAAWIVRTKVRKKPAPLRR